MSVGADTRAIELACQRPCTDIAQNFCDIYRTDARKTKDETQDRWQNRAGCLLPRAAQPAIESTIVASIEPMQYARR